MIPTLMTGISLYAVSAFNSGMATFSFSGHDLGTTSAKACRRSTAMTNCTNYNVESRGGTKVMFTFLIQHKSAKLTRKVNGKSGDEFRTALFTKTIYIGHRRRQRLSG